MRDHWQNFFKNCRSPLNILSSCFFKCCIIYPQVYVSLPVYFVKNWRNVSNSSLKDLSCSINLSCLLFQHCIVKPVIIIEWLFNDLLLKKMSPFHQNSIFHFFTSTILFFEFQKLLIQPLTLFLWNVVQSILIQNFGSFKLFVTYFKLCELDKEVLIEGLVS